MLNDFLNNNVMINSYLNLIKLIYSWSWKLAVIDFLLEVGSLFWLEQMTFGQIFKLSYHCYRNIGLLLSSSDLHRKCRLIIFKKSDYRQCPKAKLSILFYVGWPLSRCRITDSFQKLITLSVWYRLAVIVLSNRRQCPEAILIRAWIWQTTFIKSFFIKGYNFTISKMTIHFKKYENYLSL